jgi:hypothetical protein
VEHHGAMALSDRGSRGQQPRPRSARGWRRLAIRPLASAGRRPLANFAAPCWRCRWASTCQRRPMLPPWRLLFQPSASVLAPCRRWLCSNPSPSPPAVHKADFTTTNRRGSGRGLGALSGGGTITLRCHRDGPIVAACGSPPGHRGRSLSGFGSESVEGSLAWRLTTCLEAVRLPSIMPCSVQNATALPIALPAGRWAWQCTSTSQHLSLAARNSANLKSVRIC